MLKQVEWCFTCGFSCSININYVLIYKTWVVTVDHHWLTFQHTVLLHRSGILFLFFIIKKCRSEVDWLQSEVMSSTKNGGDVDCICVWIHKIYSSGLSLLSGASKCIQTINYTPPPLLLSHFLYWQSSNVLRKHLFTELQQCAHRRRRCIHLLWRYEHLLNHLKTLNQI